MNDEAIMETTIFLQETSKEMLTGILLDIVKLGADGRPSIWSCDMGPIRERLERVMLMCELGEYLGRLNDE